MKIGIVTTWFERGAAYVSKTYMDMFVNLGHTVCIYARGGDGKPDKNSEKWNESFVTRDNKYNDTQVSKRKFFRWIKKNELDLVFFNEQRHYLIVGLAKKRFPKILFGLYVDYYTEDTLSLFNIFDFVICNTRRHLQAMSGHPQAFYLKWSVDTELYKRKNNERTDGQVVFFHSVGMSVRKGTDILINAFLDGKLYEKSKLVIHTQKPIESVCKFDKIYLEGKNIDIIEKTVGAPGLYELGDVYVYPTKLDGLGLTIYEALSFGMPVITTDYPPMNEAVTKDVGSLIKPADHYCRADAYYYPMTICDKEDLIEKMRYYVDNPSVIAEQGYNARKKAVEEYSLSAMQESLSKILNNVQLRPLSIEIFNLIRKKYCSPLISAMKIISENNNGLRALKTKIYKIFKRH